MKDFGTRGTPIGAVSSQTVGNLAASAVDHIIKRGGRKKGFFRYCDDAVGFARTKAEAVRDMKFYRDEAEKLGFVVKASAFVSRIGKNVTEEEWKAGKRKRKRQRGKGRKSH